MSQTYEDYPRVRPHADAANDEQVCLLCKTPVKEIKGRLENHKPNCAYRQNKSK
jgi:hypothetical protein